MKKRVYVVWKHHHVLREWFRYKNTGMQLLSFDYHTDFHKAFLRAFASRSDSSESYESYLDGHVCGDVEVAIKDLKNDEHIDFAIRSGMIEEAFVFSCDNCTHDGVLVVPSRKKQIVPPRRGIVSYSEVGHPMINSPYDDSQMAKMAKLVTHDEVLKDVLKTFCECGFNQDDYILDFDCDFIRDKDAMTHGHFQILKTLIKGARVITIAREHGCVFKCSGGTLSYDVIEEWFKDLIQNCVGGVEIECED